MGYLTQRLLGWQYLVERLSVFCLFALWFSVLSLWVLLFLKPALAVVAQPIKALSKYPASIGLLVLLVLLVLSVVLSVIGQRVYYCVLRFLFEERHHRVPYTVTFETVINRTSDVHTHEVDACPVDPLVGEKHCVQQ